MVTCKVDSKSKMNISKKCFSASPGFRLLDCDQLDAISSVSRNSYYKHKIDSMFDDSRSLISQQQRLDDCHGSHRTESIIMYNRSDLSNNEYKSNSLNKDNRDNLNDGVHQIRNSIQSQIEKMFTDVIMDSKNSSFQVEYLGFLVIPQKIKSLHDLQDPLRQLYLSGAGQGHQSSAELNICPNAGLKIKASSQVQPQITPFQNIAVWSAVKFVFSPPDGGAAFLPLITDPENMNKASLFSPLTVAEQKRLSSGQYAPIFAVVIRSSCIPRHLECHGFVCQSAEDAVVIAATLYQSLMTHVSFSSTSNHKQCAPRIQNGVSCISLAGSSAYHNLKRSSASVEQKNPFKNTNHVPLTPQRSIRRKKLSSKTKDGDKNARFNMVEKQSEKILKKSYKIKRAPPIPSTKSSHSSSSNLNNVFLPSYSNKSNYSKSPSNIFNDPYYYNRDGTNGDILTRVAIPRSGSFLNTSGLTRYKSRVSKKSCGKLGGGGGSPLGFSELFNEFKLHENLHSLDEILNVIINADGMSFNDLKPIYKEFLLKLSVTLTKDELYQRSKTIMRRQKRKKLKLRRTGVLTNKNKRKVLLSAKRLRSAFWFGGPCNLRKIIKSTKSSCQLCGHFKPWHVKYQKKCKKCGPASRDFELRNEKANNVLNRNSSSGYVSCSESSYDSEACTCTSEDRCYCSLEENNNQVNENQSNLSSESHSSISSNSFTIEKEISNTLLSCRTNDKCYCSINNTTGNSSETTTCGESGTCTSTTKCYCKQRVAQKVQRHLQQEAKDSSKNTKSGLDYELFTVGYPKKSVKQHEALSVKKSAELAATFADLKVIQTTDIKAFENNFIGNKNKKVNSKVHQSEEINKQLTYVESERKEYKTETINFNRISHDNLDNGEECSKSGKKMSNCDNCYQTMKLASAFFEGSLGYLP